MEKANISAKFKQFSEHWRPKVVASLNGQEVRLVKANGEFPWHHHDDADEMFLLWRGRLRLEFRDRVIELEPGELLVIPRGVEHRPVAEGEAEVLLFEPAEVVNTGNIQDETFTAPLGVTL